MPRWTSLDNPAPRDAPLPYVPVAWNTSGYTELPTAPGVAVCGIATAMERRRSERSFGRVSRYALSAWLWHTSRTQQVARSDLGLIIEQRPTPSAGALHPIHLLLQEPGASAWARYNPHRHGLEMLSNDSCLTPITIQSDTLVPREDGILVLFVAEPGKTEAKYEHAESLVWRDAGVMQGVLSLAASAMGLNFCLLGMTGEPWASALSEEGKLVGVGAAILGARS